jgi:hypothetical protein
MKPLFMPKISALISKMPEICLKMDKNRKKPEKTCGNRTNLIDKVLEKAEGEMRYGFFAPA